MLRFHGTGTRRGGLLIALVKGREVRRKKGNRWEASSLANKHVGHICAPPDLDLLVCGLARVGWLAFCLGLWPRG